MKTVDMVLFAATLAIALPCGFPVWGDAAWGDFVAVVELAGSILGALAALALDMPAGKELTKRATQMTVGSLASAVLSRLVPPLLVLDVALRILVMLAWLMPSGERRHIQELGSLSPCVSGLFLVSGISWGLCVSVCCDAVSGHEMAQALTLPLFSLAWAIPLSAMVGFRDAETARMLVLVSAAGSLVGNRMWAVMLLCDLGNDAALVVPGLMTIPPLLSVVAFWLSGGHPSDEAEAGMAEKPIDSSARLVESLDSGGRLSEREKRVLKLSLDRLTVREIASVTGLAASTVSNYRIRAYKKMGVDSLQGLLEKAAELEGEDALSERGGERFSKKGAELVPHGVAFGVCVVTASAGAMSGGVAYEVAVAVFLPVLLLGSLFGVIRGKGDGFSTWNVPACALLSGASCGIVVGTLLICPKVFLLPALLCGALLMQAGVYFLVRGLRVAPAALFFALGAMAAAGSCLVPSGTAVASIAHTPLALLIAAAGMQMGAAFLWLSAKGCRANELADVLLKGDERVLSYLRGRGMNDLQAKILLLTAQGFERGHIAAVLHVSSATVSSYRSRAYTKMGIHGRGELSSLLEVHAGLKRVGVRAGEGK